MDSSDASDTDPYFPQSWSMDTSATTETVDACLGHPDGDGTYHYHIMTPCLFNQTANFTTDMCQ